MIESVPTALGGSAIPAPANTLVASTIMSAIRSFIIRARGYPPCVKLCRTSRNYSPTHGETEHLEELGTV